MLFTAIPDLKITNFKKIISIGDSHPVDIRHDHDGNAYQFDKFRLRAIARTDKDKTIYDIGLVENKSSRCLLTISTDSEPDTNLYVELRDLSSELIIFTTFIPNVRRYIDMIVSGNVVYLLLETITGKISDFVIQRLMLDNYTFLTPYILPPIVKSTGYCKHIGVSERYNVLGLIKKEYGKYLLVGSHLTASMSVFKITENENISFQYRFMLSDDIQSLKKIYFFGSRCIVISGKNRVILLRVVEEQLKAYSLDLLTGANVIQQQGNWLTFFHYWGGDLSIAKPKNIICLYVPQGLHMAIRKNFKENWGDSFVRLIDEENIIKIYEEVYSQKRFILHGRQKFSNLTSSLKALKATKLSLIMFP